MLLLPLPAAAQNSRPVPELGSPGSLLQPPGLSPRTFPGAPPANTPSDEVKDPRTGCGVVRMNAEPDVGITWSGACEHDLAQGPGVLQWTKGGKPTDRYDGEMKDGLYEGTGKITYANKARYEGGFKAGERDGRGTYVFASGAKLIGQFVEGKPVGRGTYIWPNGNRYIGDFRNNQRTGQGTLLYADGGRYEGEFANGKAHGRGVRVWPNGARYDGEWRDDTANGWGTKRGADGQTFTGTWQNGCFRENRRWATVNATPASCGFQ